MVDSIKEAFENALNHENEKKLIKLDVKTQKIEKKLRQLISETDLESYKIIDTNYLSREPSDITKKVFENNSNIKTINQLISLASEDRLFINLQEIDDYKIYQIIRVLINLHSEENNTNLISYLSVIAFNEQHKMILKAHVLRSLHRNILSFDSYRENIGWIIDNTLEGNEFKKIIDEFKLISSDISETGLKKWCKNRLGDDYLYLSSKRKRKTYASDHLRDKFHHLHSSINNYFSSENFSITEMNSRDFILCDEDFELISSWTGIRYHADINNWVEFLDFSKEYKKGFEGNKFSSARIAEHSGYRFYQSLGRNVIDTSISQIDGSNNKWLTHDLEVNGKPVDVKNSRRGWNSRYYTEHIIKEFKKNELLNEVIYLGILSEYLSFNKIAEGKTANIRVLGEVKNSDLSELKTWINDNFLGILDIDHLENLRLIPGWAFEYPNDLYILRNSKRNILKEEIKKMIIEDKNNIERISNNISLFHLSELIRELKNEEGFEFFEPKEHVKPTNFQRNILKQIYHLNKSIGITRRSLYLLILGETIKAIKESSSEYNFDDLRNVIFNPSDYGYCFPLDLFDPESYIFNLISVLENLWVLENDFMKSFKSFQLSGASILKGLDKNNNWLTIMAYCGGWDEINNVKCGANPIYLGNSESCSKCYKLICSHCDHCSDYCVDNKKRIIN